MGYHTNQGAAIILPNFSMTFLCCVVNFFITSTKYFNENPMKAVLLTQPVMSDLTYEKE
jgi:hypothetical protein